MRRLLAIGFLILLLSCVGPVPTPARAATHHSHSTRRRETASAHYQHALNALRAGDLKKADSESRAALKLDPYYRKARELREILAVQEKLRSRQEAMLKKYEAQKKLAATRARLQAAADLKAAEARNLARSNLVAQSMTIRLRFTPLDAGGGSPITAPDPAETGAPGPAPIFHGRVRITALAHELQPGLVFILAIAGKPVRLIRAPNGAGGEPEFPYAYDMEWNTAAWRDGVTEVAAYAYYQNGAPFRQVIRRVVVANTLGPDAAALEAANTAPGLALDNARQFQNDHPESWDAQIVMEDASFRAGDFAGGRAAEASALKLHPLDTTPLLMAGDAEYRSGDAAGARREYEQAQQLEPHALVPALSMAFAAARLRDSALMSAEASLLTTSDSAAAAVVYAVLGEIYARDPAFARQRDAAWRQATRLDAAGFPPYQMAWSARMLEILSRSPERTDATPAPQPAG